jgi:hypothetical protein
MLSYPLPEAQELLTSKLSAAERQLANTTEDVEFIREQATIMDVNTARVYNFDVSVRFSASSSSSCALGSIAIGDV